MPLGEVIAASTVNAAKALQRPELGSLAPGSVGDATLLELKDGSFRYEDVTGEIMTGDRRILARGAVVGGRVFHPAEPDAFRASASHSSTRAAE
jgi:dihydroorotase